MKQAASELLVKIRTSVGMDPVYGTCTWVTDVAGTKSTHSAPNCVGKTAIKVALDSEWYSSQSVKLRVTVV